MVTFIEGINSIKKSIKKHPKILMFIGMDILASLSLGYYFIGPITPVYHGSINNYQIIYQEAPSKNILWAKKGFLEYAFEDNSNKTNIDWENPNKPDFEKDALEKIVLRVGGFPEEYLAGENNPNGSINSSKVFSVNNKLYNDLRIEIRKNLIQMNQRKR